MPRIINIFFKFYSRLYELGSKSKVGRKALLKGDLSQSNFIQGGQPTS